MDIREDDEKLISIENVLKIFQVGTRPVNYYLLKMLPTTIPNIMNAVKVNKPNANRHVNELEGVGLLERARGTGNVTATARTHIFINSIELMEIPIKEYVKQALGGTD